MHWKVVLQKRADFDILQAPLEQLVVQFFWCLIIWYGTPIKDGGLQLVTAQH